MAFTWNSNINQDEVISLDVIKEMQTNLDYISNHLANIADEGTYYSGQYSGRQSGQNATVESTNYGYCGTNRSGNQSAEDSSYEETANSGVYTIYCPSNNASVLASNLDTDCWHDNKHFGAVI